MTTALLEIESDNDLQLRQIPRLGDRNAVPVIHKRFQVLRRLGREQIQPGPIGNRPSVYAAIVRLPQLLIFISEHVAEGEVYGSHKSRVVDLNAEPILHVQSSV